MKRSLTLFLASLMLVFALTACGSKDNGTQDSQNGNQHETVTDGAAGKDDRHPGTDGGSLAEDAGNAVNDGLDGVENAVDDLTGDAARTHRN